jgi:hypothetical protein
MMMAAIAIGTAWRLLALKASDPLSPPTIGHGIGPSIRNRTK